MHLPTPVFECSAVFDHKQHDSRAPTPHSTDLSPSNFFVVVVSWMKRVLKGKCFADVEEAKQKMAEVLKGIKITEFKNCFEQWKKHLDGCIAPNGEYLEGD